MTESNVPAVRTTAEVTATDTDSWVDVAAPVFRLADNLANTEFVPAAFRGNAPAVAGAMLYGREVGLPPMTSLQGIHVIEGRPSLSAEMLRALVLGAGHEIAFVESTGARCVMRGRRRGQETWTSVEWTTDMARAAGLLGKKNWQKDPRSMLVARASTSLCRMIFADVIHGFSSIEELVDDDAEVVEGQPQSTTRVSRASKRPAAKKAAPLPAAERPEPVAGPPLPGEDGYAVQGTQTPQPPAEVPLPDTETTDAPTLPGDGGAADESPGDGEGEAPDPGGSEAPNPRPASRAQVRMLMARLQSDFEVKDDQDRYDIASTLTGRTVESYNDLTASEASRMIEELADLETREQLDALLAERSQS